MAKKPSKRPARARVSKATKHASRTTRPGRKSEEQTLIDSLVAHGQAVKVPAGGKLAPGATHELVESEDGEVRVVRRRFSAI